MRRRNTKQDPTAEASIAKIRSKALIQLERQPGYGLTIRPPFAGSGMPIRVGSVLPRAVPGSELFHARAGV